VHLAFVPGSYETVVVRDRAGGDTLEVTLDEASGARVDPAELRRRDRELAGRLGGPLSAQLRDLLLRHPELDAVRVVVTRGRDEPAPLRISSRAIAALAQEPGVTLVELAEDPEIPDAGP
jgi:hypothetical protein